MWKTLIWPAEWTHAHTGSVLKVEKIYHHWMVTFYRLNFLLRCFNLPSVLS